MTGTGHLNSLVTVSRTICTDLFKEVGVTRKADSAVKAGRIVAVRRYSLPLRAKMPPVRRNSGKSLGYLI